jgi:hypothetical protein
MSSRSLKRGLTNGVQRKTLVFRFFPQGTSQTPLTTAAGTLRDPGGVVANVTRTSTAGKFLVTMVDPYYRVIDVRPSVQLNGDTTDLTAQWGAVTNEGTALPLQFVVRLLAGATNTDMAANANNSVSVTLEVEDSSAAGVA